MMDEEVVFGNLLGSFDGDDILPVRYIFPVVGLIVFISVRYQAQINGRRTVNQ
jgi:hypothetical protein